MNVPFKYPLLSVSILFILTQISFATEQPAKEATNTKVSVASNSAVSASSTAASKDPAGDTQNKLLRPKTTTAMASTSSAVVTSAMGSNVQAASVQVEPFMGSANLSIPIQTPPGRGGIQPALALSYSSGNRQLGLAGIGWMLDLGSIQRSTKKGVPTYDNAKDIFVISQGSQELVKDPNVSNRYYPEVEGGFAKIEFLSSYWRVTDKKGTKYYFGSTDDSRQYDPANLSRVFRWALNKVEDLNGNYMTIAYVKDNGQIYPQSIAYTGNSQQGLNPYALVTINYTGSSQAATSYISGFKISTAKRIDTIKVAVNSVNQTTYTFKYRQSASTQRDLLQSVQQIGSDGSTTLPAVAFNYTDAAVKGFTQDLSWSLSNIPSFSLNTDHWTDLGVRVMDLNGDVYPDLVKYSNPFSSNITNQAYLNTKQKSWNTTASWKISMASIPNIPDGFVSYTQIDRYTGLTPVDIDGDGLSDTIQNFKRDGWSGGTNIKSAAINNGQNGFNFDAGWNLPDEAMITYELGQPTYGYTVPGATGMGDVNGDGLVDMAIARTEWYPSNAVYLNNKASGSKGWTRSSVYSTPSGIDFIKGGALVDLNGDGLADIIHLKAGVCRVFLNTGAGWQEISGGYANTFGFGDLTNLSTQFMDVNGDGLVDILINKTHMLINTGNGWFEDNAWLPAGVDLTNLGTQFLDADANGMIDYIVAVSGQTSGIYMNQGKPADMLSRIDNGIGAVTDIVYDSSARFINRYMPFVQQVVKSVSISDGFNHTYTTNYSYANGYWDVGYREFQGFGSVSVADANNNYTVTTFLQDHWLKGRPSETSSYDSTGKLYTKSVNQWVVQNVITNALTGQTSKFVYVSRSDNYLYDGTSTAKRTAQESFYAQTPQYGDPTQVINYGEVDASSGDDIGTDKVISQITYVNNPSIWLLGIPSQTISLDYSGNKISQTSFYYDGASSLTTTPSLGRLTAKVNWLGSSSQSDPRTTYSYDALGNLQTTTDPMGNTTSIVYDNSVYMFPVQTTNALNQKTQTAYYGVAGESLDNGIGLRGLWGQVKSVTDANNVSAYSAYDTLGRPTITVSPKDTLAAPSAQRSYQIFSNYVAVTTKTRVEHGQALTIDTVEFSDGLGRLIQTKSLGPRAGQYIVSGQTEYDQRGLPVKRYLPRFTSNDLNTMDAIDTAVPSTQMIYDPMGRAIKTINADGTYANVVYDHWSSLAFDENGHMQKSYVDAAGRLIKKEEYSGADGRWADYPAAPYTLYATTTYAYDALGNLTTVTDTKGNITTISYDRLNRKTGMNDPDMGVWQYEYDANGNLIAQTDAKGQVIRFSYDALNRLLNKTDGIPAGPINNFPNLTPPTPSFNVVYSFDAMNQSFGKGRLGTVSYNNGQASFTYDELGREVASSKKINTSTYNVSREYDALNRIKELQYPDGAKVKYFYNQAGQVESVSDANFVQDANFVPISSPLSKKSMPNQALAWIGENILGIKEAYAATTTASIYFNMDSNKSYELPVNIPLDITAIAASGNSIVKVEIFAGTQLIGTLTQSPYFFIWSNPSVGTYSLTAKLTDNKGNTKTSLPISITIKPHRAPYIGLSGVANGGNAWPLPVTFNLTASAITYNATVSQINIFDGSLIKSCTSTPCSVSVVNPLVGSHGFKAEVIDSTGAKSTSSVIFVNVSQAAPIVTLTEPVNNAVYARPATIVLRPSINVLYGTIEKVEFYDGSSLIGTVLNSPYTYTLNNVTLGTHTFTAKVYNNGVVGTSPGIKVSVKDVPLPTVNFITPQNNSSYFSSSDILLYATAGSPNGLISKVDFYNGTTLLGTVTSEPFNYTWSNVPAGNYSLTAKATDQTGVTAISASINVLVEQRPAPVVSLNLSDVVDTYPGSVALTGTASATNARVSKLEFFSGTTLLGTLTDTYFGTYTWSNIPVGNYSLTVKATDSLGASTVSTPVNLTIAAHAAPAISLTTSNTTYTAPAGIVLTANASATKATVSKVEFYNGSTLLSTVTSSPYTYTWNGVMPGSYNVTAKATDSFNATTVSTPVALTVTAPVTPPTVSLTSPNSNQAFLVPANISMSAAASAAYGTISKVEFYEGSNLLSTVTSGPYAYTWNDALPGSYVLTAKAYDSYGNTAVSSSVPVTVTAQANQYIKHISYNAQGQMTQIEYGNGTLTSYHYDPLNFRLKRIYTVDNMGNKIQDLNYTYDAVGQIKTITDAVNTSSQNFQYDELNRLTRAQGSYGVKTYAYDQIGNIVQKDGLTYQYGELNGRVDGSKAGPHAVTYLSDGSTFKYDANGNMVLLKKGNDTTGYVYDAQNRLQGALNNGTKVSDYFYDGDGGRVKKIIYARDIALYNVNTGTMLFNSKGQPATLSNPGTDTTIYVGNLYEEESTGRKSKYIYIGSTRIASVSNSGQVFYYHTDHLGGTNVISDRLGMARELTEYDPFGVVIRHDRYGAAISSGWYFFTGKELDDETGLMYYGARYYNPKLGRFITPDTIVQAPSNPQTLNRYTYCNNNPVNLVDPSGHFWFIPAIIAAVKAVVAAAIAHPVITAGIINAAVNVGTNIPNIHNVGDFLTYAGIGYATGVASGGVGLGTSNALGSVLGKFGSAFAGSVAGGVTNSVSTVTADGLAKGVAFNDAVAFGLSTAPTAAIVSGGTFVVSYGAIKAVNAIQQANAARSTAGSANSIGSNKATAAGSLSINRQDSVVGKQALIKVNIARDGEVLSSDPAPMKFPPNYGFEGDPALNTLQPGAMVDRYGSSKGAQFLSPQGTPFAARSLSSEVANLPLNTYEVVRPIDVLSGKVAGWYGQPGKGIQHFLGDQYVDVLEQQGYLRKVNNGTGN